MNERYTEFSDDFLKIENVTLNNYIEYLVKLSDSGLGETPVCGEPNKAALIPFYDKSTGKLYF